MKKDKGPEKAVTKWVFEGGGGGWRGRQERRVETDWLLSLLNEKGEEVEPPKNAMRIEGAQMEDSQQ